MWAAAPRRTCTLRSSKHGGFTVAWAAEHHALEMTIAPNPFSILTWWADNTDRIRLGPAVVAAAYWHPIKAAGEAAFVDLISGGRLEFDATPDPSGVTP